jgi:hypothetical protein
MPLPKPMVQGYAGNTPNEAALNNASASNILQTSLNKLMGGFLYSRKLKPKNMPNPIIKHSKIKRGGGTLEVPLIDTPYTPVGAGGQTPNGISSSIFQSATQGESNAQYDSLVGAGKRYRRKAQKSKKKRKLSKKLKTKQTRLYKKTRRKK